MHFEATIMIKILNLEVEIATIMIKILHLEVEIVINNMDKQVKKLWQERGQKA